MTIMMRRSSIAVLASMSVLSACTLLFSDSDGTSDGGDTLDARNQDASLVDAEVSDGMSAVARCGKPLLETIGLFSVDGDDDTTE